MYIGTNNSNVNNIILRPKYQM